MGGMGAAWNPKCGKYFVPTKERRNRHRNAGLEVLLTEKHRGVGDHQGRERRNEGVHHLVGEVSPEAIGEWLEVTMY